MSRRQQRTGSTVLRAGPAAVRVRPWPDDPAIAQLVPVAGAVAPTRRDVARWQQHLGELGYRAVRTAALGPSEREPWRGAGFDVVDELHLLRHDLQGRLPAPAQALRRVGRRGVDGLAEVDAVAFGTGWRLDAAAIRDACHATRWHRLRAVGEPAVAYAITGRAGRCGFVQRLAVAPTSEGRGLGTALVLDGLRWLRSHHLEEALVNTRLGNDRALDLYLRLGFQLLTERLAVLGAPLEVAA